MRLWSLHPSYLDARGLVALWREGLLAQKVLQGRTRGYRSHPQLKRFQELGDPVSVIASYLKEVADEATRRGYEFDAGKIHHCRARKKIVVTSGQLDYEVAHLRRKLWKRDRRCYHLLVDVKTPKSHPMFVPQPGPVESWEVMS